MIEFKKGDEVKIWNGGMFPEYGVIVKVNKKTVRVRTEDGSYCVVNKREVNFD